MGKEGKVIEEESKWDAGARFVRVESFFLILCR